MGFNVLSRQVLAFADKKTTKSAAFSSDIALWDIIYLILTSFVYFGLVILIEAYKVRSSVLNIITR
jgi:hypothetical protein